MEEILKRIIEIDTQAKAIVQEEKTRKLNIDEIIESEYTAKKALLDLEYKDEIKNQINIAQSNLEEKKKEIDKHLDIEIEKIKAEYEEKENEIINEIICSIKKEEE